MPNLFLTLLSLYLVLISIIAIFITIHDKRSAIHHRWRVPEATLLLISALGGSVAMYITMQLIRHKTKHLNFMLGIPLIIVLQVAVAVLIWRFFYV